MMNRYKVTRTHYNNHLKSMVGAGQIVELDKGYADEHRDTFVPLVSSEERVYEDNLSKGERKKKETF
jgi:hypothetical protein